MNTELQNLSDLVKKRAGRKEEAEEKFTEATTKWEAQVKAVSISEKAEALIELLTTRMNSQVSLPLIKVTQAAVDSVFPGEYTVKIDFSIKNHRTHVDVYLDSKGNKLYPLDDEGGGVANMMELGLRLAALEIGQTRRTIVLDQPFKDLSEEYLPLAGKILQKLSKERKIQLIIINHIPGLKPIADRTFQFNKNLETDQSEFIVIDKPQTEEESYDG